MGAEAIRDVHCHSSSYDKDSLQPSLELLEVTKSDGEYSLKFFKDVIKLSRASNNLNQALNWMQLWKLFAVTLGLRANTLSPMSIPTRWLVIVLRTGIRYIAITLRYHDGVINRNNRIVSKPHYYLRLYRNQLS